MWGFDRETSPYQLLFFYEKHGGVCFEVDALGFADDF